MRRLTMIICALTIGVLALFLYFQQQPPHGVEVMSDQSIVLQWLTLAIGLVSLLTGIIGLIQKLIELRQLRRG